MTDADLKLKALFRAEPPPVLDARFRLAVLERMERRRAQVKLGLLLAIGLVATVAAAACGPALSASVGQLPLAVIGVMVALGTTAWGVMQLHRPI